MMGYMPVLDAIDPLPPRKPPLGRIPEHLRPPMVTVPGHMRVSDLPELKSPWIRFRRYPMYEDDPVRGVPSATNPLGRVGYDVKVVVDNNSTASGLRLLMDATAKSRDALAESARRSHAVVLQEIYEHLIAQATTRESSGDARTSSPL